MARRRALTIGLALAGPAVLLIGAASVRFLLPYFGIDTAAMLVEAVVPRIAADLPQRVDRYVIWESLTAEGSRAVFTYRLDITSHTSSTREFLADVQARMPDIVCDQLSLRSLVWLGGEISFRFYDGRNNMLRRIDFDPGACTA